MRAYRARLSALLVVAGILAAGTPARADTAAPPNSTTTWNEYASTATFGAGQGAFGVANMALVQGAVYDAVNAIDRRARPYLRAPHAKRWYSKDAAVAAAAYGVLRRRRPAGDRRGATPHDQAALRRGARGDPPTGGPSGAGSGPAKRPRRR